MTDFPQNLHGSRQLRVYRNARRDGLPTERAAEIAGIALTEAKLIDADDAKNPPPAEAFEDPAAIGHNSGETTVSSTVAADQLRLFIERVERLEEEKKGIADDIRDVYAEAKSQGYDAKIMRQCIRLRKMQPHDLQEMQSLLETYAAALGIQYGLGI